ncbi:MAG: hypothetical protein HZC14_03420 [Candidatus Niyogibacteria bacterium]|nr:hypothetical protein [Candidatus Niyogibacteria bacterium]
MDNDLMSKRPYWKEVFRFYFAPVWQSALTILYLLFFLYFAIFYSGNVWTAIKFILYTLAQSGSLLGLAYLFWGVIFLITLIIPFSVSAYAMLLLYDVWIQNWSKKDKIFGTALLILLVPIIIILMDDVVRVVASQGVLRSFVEANNLNISGK